MTVPPCSRGIIVALMIGVGAAAGPAAPAAHAQASQADLDDISYRLRRLERQFNTLRGGNEDIPSSLATRFQSRLDQMERTIQTLTDKVEDLIHRAEKTEKERKAFEADTDYRLSLLEKQGGARAGSKPVNPAPGADAGRKQASGEARGEEGAAEKEAAAAPILPPGKEIDQYRFAIGELRQARYDRATQAFREFLRRHPKGRFAGNAYYWLGETYYAQQKYRLAAIRFADGFKIFPKHPKAPDNLLKLGMSMAHLKKTEEACASWKELQRRYPSAPGYIKRKAAQERKRLGCRS